MSIRVQAAAFDPGAEVEVEQGGQVEHVHLMHAGDVEQREQRTERDVGAGFLLGFAHGGLGGGFIVFHEAGRQGPIAVARLDGALAQQDLQGAVRLPHRNRAQHHFRVLIVDRAAGGANVAGTVVAGRNRQADGGGAFGTEFHKGGGSGRMVLFTLATLHRLTPLRHGLCILS